MSAVIAYLALMGGAIGLALALFFGFRAIKLI
ncbi:MAG: cytochrome b6-f complex subunit PetL [Phormidesmis sp. CAN_BIN36]|nr:cytochrome b6-f complex subunit PetL [Phormidesmis sp. CAN_BIN36]